jgi:PAS domain S-box-containing protein
MPPDQLPVRLLLVDDDREQLALIDAALSRTHLDYRIEWSPGYDDALARLDAGGVDLCLVDYLLDGINGLDLIRDAVARGIETPMVMLTAHGSAEVSLQALEAGAVDYLAKGTVDAELLERTVRYAMERARIMSELRRNEERLRTIVARSPMAIFAADREGVIEFADGRVLEMIGLSPVDLVGRRLDEVYREDQAIAGRVRRVLAGEPISTVVNFGEVWLESHTSPTFDRDGRVNGVVGVSTDVTSRVRAENEQARLLKVVEQERARLAGLVARLPVVVWESEYDPAGELRQTYVSEYIENLTGFTADEWLSDAGLWERLVHPDDRSIVHVPSDEVISSGEARRRYRIVRRDDGVAWIDVRFSLMRRDDGEVTGLRGIALDVTEQMLTEERLVRSEQLFESFMEYSPILNFIKDVDGRYLFGNAAFGRLAGRPTAEIIGATDNELWPAETAEAFRRNDRDVIAADEALQFTERVFDRGIEVISHVIKFPIRAADGSVLLGGIAVDITARVRAEDSLRKSEERFMLSSRATNDVVYDWDLGTDTVWWNENLALHYGYILADDETSLAWWESTIHPDDHDDAMAGLNHAIAERAQTWSGEYRFRRADGTYAHVLDRGHLIYDDAGHPQRMIGAMIDLTERLKWEHELRKREEEFRRIVETAQEGIWVTDRHGVTTFVNATMARMLGYSIEAMMGTKFERYLDADAREAARSNKERRERGLSEKYDLRLIRHDGQPIWTIVSANPIFDDRGELVGSLAMVNDITARRRAEDALRDARDELEHRVEERTAELAAAMVQLEQAHHVQRRFVADASHDLRTPLTVVRAELDLLLASPLPDAGTRMSLMRALSEVERLDHLATDLLTLATIDSREDGTPRVAARLDEILLESISTLTALARDRRITWSIDIDDAVEIACDRASLQRALNNVLDNALKYSSEESTVAIHFARDGATARIDVRDNGIGIPPRDLPRIFDRFYRSDAARSTQGTGLGLPIVRSVVESHGGRVQVQSEVGKGTLVTIELPIE